MGRGKLIRVRGSKGINLLEDPRNIDDEELVRAKNLVPVGPAGNLMKRRTAAYDRELLTTTDANYYTRVPLAIEEGEYTNVLAFATKPNDSTDPIIRVGGSWMSAAIAAADAAAWRKGIPTQLPVTMYFDGNVYLFSRDRQLPDGVAGYSNMALVYPGVAVVFVVVNEPLGITDGNKLITFIGTQTQQVIPAGGTPYRRRVVYWDLNTGYADYLVFSDDADPLVIGTDALAGNGRSFYLNVRSEGRIVSCVDTAVMEVSDPNAALLVLKEYAGYLLTGEPNQSTDTTAVFGDMNTVRFNMDISCMSHQSVVTTPYGIIWAGVDEVWLFQVGHNPIPIGKKIRPVLQRQPAAYRWKVFAAYHDGFYRLALWDEGSAGSWNGTPEVQYWLDLRAGAPANGDEAKWWGPQEYLIQGYVSVAPSPGMYCMSPSRRKETAAKLYSAHLGETINGDPYGVVRLSIDGETANDLALDTTLYGGPAYNTNSPLIDLWSKEYTDGDEMVNKLYQGAEVTVRAGQKLQLAAEAILNGNTGGSENSSVMTAEGFNLDIDQLDLTTLGEQFDTKLIACPDGVRPVGTSVQLRLSDVRGHVIDDTNDTFRVKVNGTFVVYTAVLTHGLYATLGDLLEEIETKLDTAYGGNLLDSYLPAAVTDNSLVQFTFIPQVILVNDEGTYGATENNKMLALCALLGFDPTGAEFSVYGTTQFGSGEAPAWNPAHALELGGIVLRVNTQPRRPQ